MLLDRLRTDRPEILDTEGLSERGLRILDALDRWNRLTGWDRLHARCARLHWEALGRPRPFRILDVGSGTGTFLLALHEWAARAGVPVELTGVEIQPAFAAAARERLGDRAEILVADATALDADPDTWDLATCALMMHHVPKPVRAALIAEIGRTCRSAYIFDLEFTAYGVLGSPLVYAVLPRDAAHDGALSVRRASTMAEMEALVAPLGVRVRRRFPSAMYTLPG